MFLKLFIESYGDNNWIDNIVKYIPHISSSIDDCDYIITSKIPWGCINMQYIQDVLNSYKDNSKKVIVFLVPTVMNLLMCH